MGQQTKKPMAEYVYETLKDKIINMELKMRQPLIEEELSEEFEVSRTPVREALRQLQRDGFVENTPYRGCFVKEITSDDIIDIYTIRQALEGICARNAATTLSKENVALIEQNWEKSVECHKRGDYRESLESGNILHDMVLRVGGGKRTNQMVSNIKEHTQRLHLMAALLPNRNETSIREHADIIAALKATDPDLAESSMRAHILSTQKDVLYALKNSTFDVY